MQLATSVHDSRAAEVLRVNISSPAFYREFMKTSSENKMEECKNIDYGNIPVGWDWDMPTDGYWRVWEVQENVPQSGMKQITIMVVV